MPLLTNTLSSKSRLQFDVPVEVVEPALVQDGWAGSGARDPAARTSSAGAGGGAGPCRPPSACGRPYLELQGAHAVTMFSHDRAAAFRARRDVVEGQVFRAAAVLARETRPARKG